MADRGPRRNGAGSIAGGARKPLFSPLEEWGPSAFFKLSLLYLVVLLVLPVAYGANLWGFRERLSDPIGDLIPVGVPLAGALGAVTISLYGVFQHNTTWDKRWNYWHFARPFMGALLGSVACLIFIATIQSTGVDPAVDVPAAPTTTSTVASATTTNPAAAAPGAPPTTRPAPAPANRRVPRDLIIYYVIAFVVGYREETFRELIKRAGDILFKPGAAAAGRLALIADRPVGDAPHTVVFTPVAAVASTSWTLEFGDGSSHPSQSGSPTTVAHTYLNPGVFLAAVEVIEDSGAKATATVQVTVTGTAAPPPAATAIADPGVQQIQQAATDEERRAIERSLIAETDKFPEHTDADDS